MRHRLVATVLVATLSLSANVSAQSPSPSIAPALSPVPGRDNPSCRLADGSTLARHDPAPPATFDAASIDWIGNERGRRRQQGIAYGDQVWVGGLDGSALRLVRDGDVMAARRLPRGSVAAVLGEDVAERLVTIDAAGEESSLGPADDARFAVDPAGTTAFVWRAHEIDGAQGDVWRIPLDGFAADVALPSVRAPEVIVASPDGRGVAAGRLDGDDGPYWMVVRSGDHPALRLKNLVPLGFDAGGRLLAVAGLEVIRIDPQMGRRSSLIPPLSIASGSDAIVTPTGRTLVLFDQSMASAVPTLTARNLATGRERTWRLPRDAEWYLTDLGTGRYVVLGRDTGLFTTEWAVVDLAEGWLGFVSFCPPAGVTTAAEPAAAADPSPSPSLAPATSPALLPAPPEYFDPGTIPYVGSRFGIPGELGDLWFGRLDGSGMRAVPVPDNGIGHAVAGNAIVVTARGPAGSAWNRLVLVRADGSTVDLLTDQKGLFAVSYAGDAVYTFRADGRTTESVSGLWRVPIDGTKPRRVLPRAPGGSHVAVSPDERSFAMGWKIGDQPLKLTARVDLGPVRRPVAGLPLGFDAAGRLIFDGGRFDPESGTTSPIKGMGRANGLIVTSDGRTMLALVGGELRALDLVTGTRRTWDLAPGDWFLTELSTGRYAVAARWVDDPDYEVVDTFAVVDLFEGWLGYVPFTVPS